MSVYNAETMGCIGRLRDEIDAEAAARVWRRAIGSKWDRSPAWVHGDFAAPNLLVKDARLSGVIDFGQLAAGLDDDSGAIPSAEGSYTPHSCSKPSAEVREERGAYTVRAVAT